MQLTKKAQLSGHNASVYCLSPYNKPNLFLSSGGDGWIVVWDIDSPENGRLLASADANIFSMKYISDRNWVVAGNMYGGIHWIDLSSQKSIKSVLHHKKGVFTFHQPNADQLLSLGGDGILSLWDINSCRALESLEISSQPLRALAKHPNQNLLAIGSSDTNIYILDSESLSIKKVINQAHSNSVFSLAFSPDGKYLLSGGRDAHLRIRVCAEDFRELPTQPAHLFTVNDIVYNPTASLIATASRDKSIRIWDAQSFALLKVIDTIKHGAHLKSVNRLLWTENGLISCSDDRSIIIWDI